MTHRLFSALAHKLLAPRGAPMRPQPPAPSSTLLPRRAWLGMLGSFSLLPAPVSAQATPAPLPGLASQRASVNGVELHYWIGGSGPAVVLIHGWMGTAYTWRKVAPLLTPHHTVLIPDMRGHGDSDKPAAGYDARNLKDDVRQLVQRLGLQRPFVLGHDMGAPVAYMYAVDHPDEARGMGYLDEPLLSVDLDHFTAFSRRFYPGGFWWYGFNYEPGVAEMLITGREREFFTYKLKGMSIVPGAVTEADIDEYVRTFKAPGGVTGSMGWYRDAFKTIEQMQAALPSKLTVPVLAVGAERGLRGTFQQLQQVAHDVQGGVIAGSGHSIAEDQPEKLAAVMLAFFDRVLARTR